MLEGGQQILFSSSIVPGTDSVLDQDVLFLWHEFAEEHEALEVQDLQADSEKAHADLILVKQGAADPFNGCC